MEDKEIKEERYYSCFYCGSTFELRKFKEKWICEKCSFWYDTHPNDQPNKIPPSSPIQSSMTSHR